MSPPDPPVSVSLPAPPNRFAAGIAPLLSSMVMMSLPSRPKAWISLVLATVAGPPLTATAPPLTTIVPPALRPSTIVLFMPVPRTERIPAEKFAVTAMCASRLRDCRNGPAVSRRFRDAAGEWQTRSSVGRKGGSGLTEGFGLPPVSLERSLILRKADHARAKWRGARRFNDEFVKALRLTLIPRRATHSRSTPAAAFG